jgi:hypothetical protein
MLLNFGDKIRTLVSSIVQMNKKSCLYSYAVLLFSFPFQLPESVGIAGAIKLSEIFDVTSKKAQSIL